MKTVTLYSEKQDCCGCGACANICPKGAIGLVPDDDGFLYPVIDHTRCVGCGLCQSVCGFQKMPPDRVPEKAYAAANQERETLLKSASGGVAAVLAQTVLQRGGVVVGCAMKRCEDVLQPMHIAVEKPEELVALQGSKYVQSYIGNTYTQVRDYLKQGREVFFVGTPCQVAGLRGFLGKQDHPGLLTADIICHGVPSAGFFQSYIAELERELKGTVQDYRFRDKSTGWGLRAGVYYRDSWGKSRHRLLPVKAASYYALFLQGQTYRESCYSCPFATGARSGDITLGDYWGIGQVHPSYLRENGGELYEGEGISCVLVNTPRGEAALKQAEEHLTLLQSDVPKVQQGNDQLNHPSPRGEDRQTLLQLYREHGYRAVECWYRKRLGIKWYRYALQSRIPPKLRARLKRIRN